MQELLITNEHIINLYADNYALLLHYYSQHTFIYEGTIEFVDKLFRIEDERIYRNIFLSLRWKDKDGQLIPLFKFLPICN